MIFYEIKYKYLERLFFMNQTNLGITSLKISAMGLGIMRMNAKTPQQATEALEAAFDNGINFIDSADIYGQGESEKIFGQVLKLSKIKRDDLFIQSKVGIIVDPDKSEGSRVFGGRYEFTKDHILEAIENEATHHWVNPFNLKTDKPLALAPKTPNSTSIMVNFLKKHIQNQKNILAINAAIPHMFGLKEIKENYPNYKDVGIAEQESIAFAAGAVKEGITPIWFENSTLLQRAYDQLSHDVATNDLPVVMVVIGGGVTNTSKTHVGVFDNMMIANWPN